MNKALKSCAPEEGAPKVQRPVSGLVLPATACVILSKSLQTLSLSFLISNQELA